MTRREMLILVTNKFVSVGGIESLYKLHFPWFIRAGTLSDSQSAVSIPAHGRLGQLDTSSLSWAKH